MREEEAIKNIDRRLVSAEVQRIANLERKLVTIQNRLESIEKAAANNIQLIVEARNAITMRELNRLPPKALPFSADRLDLLEDRIEKLEEISFTGLR